MPRRKIDPSVPTFDFKKNPAKELSPRTLNNYKNYLNKITELSYLAHQKDMNYKVIETKDDLLNHPAQVIEYIKDFTDNRMKLCGLYSAIFYVIGHQDYQQDSRGKKYLDEFRKIYYDENYMKILESAKK